MPANALKKMRTNLINKNCLEFEPIIKDWFDDIEKTKKIWEEIRTLNPDFEQVSEDHWQQKEACFWLHGETDTWKANKLEEWLMIAPSLSETAKSIALKHYLKWENHIREEGDYFDFSANDLQSPEEKEILVDFILKIAEQVEKKGWGNKKQTRAKKSFLHFLRDKYKKEVAFIEHIIPEKNGLRSGSIIRLIPPQVYPISQEIAASIIKELAYQSCYGRSNSRHHNLEALILILMSVSASRIRWPRTLESVHEIKKNALIFKDESKELLIPSVFGNRSLEISNRFGMLIQAVSNIPSKKTRKTILQTSLPDLRKTLRSAIKKVNPPKEVGDITFLTFLSHPHYFGKNIR